MAESVRRADVDAFHNTYPGARPLRPSEEGLLLGRDGKLTDLVDAIRSTPVVEFTAPSGLGKSSLLEAGVLPRLDAERFTVAPLRSWAGLSPPKRDSDADVAPVTDYYAAAVGAALRARNVDDGGFKGTQLLDFLAETYGPTLVVIFDQFEELLRDDPTLGRRFLERVVFVAKAYPFHQVISMRSEFKEELRGLEENLRYNQWTWIGLEDVDEGVAAEIVVAPLTKPSTVPTFCWEPEVVNGIAAWWKEARRRDWKVGLLHLQAFLWSVVEQLRPAPRTQITDAAVRELVSAWLSSGPDREGGDKANIDPLALFRAALTVYVDLRLGTPSTTFDADRRQALYAASRYSSELSSAGYKLVRGTVELARFAFPGVKGELSFSESFIEEAVRAAESQLLAGDVETALITMAATLPGQLRQDHFDRRSDLEVGESEGTAGPMATRSALEAACAEIAAYEQSLQLLADRSLVRLTPSIDGSRRVALIHDGFGDAVEAWGKKVGRDPLAAIESTTALSAKQILDGLGEAGLDSARLAITGSEVIEYARWIGCYITANISNVLFRNCRFSSTLFKDCNFENVRFENCEFRGALFLGCTFKGTDGTVIAVLDDDARARCRISAVTVKLSGMAEGGLTFTGMEGSGLLFEKCHGGPWKLESCDLRHVSIDGSCDASSSQEPLWGTIERCPLILHLSISGDVAEQIMVKDSKVRLGSYPAGHRLAGDPKSILELTTSEQA